MIISSFWREKKIKIIFSTGLFFLVRPFVVEVIKMHWYTVGDMVVNISLVSGWILVNIRLLLEWINCLVWSTYDPATDSHISPCAMTNDTKCNWDYIRSDYYARKDCFLTPDYCEITMLGTNVFVSMFCVFGVLIMYSIWCYSCIKSGLPKEKKSDHIE